MTTQAAAFAQEARQLAPPPAHLQALHVFGAHSILKLLRQLLQLVRLRAQILRQMGGHRRGR